MSKWVFAILFLLQTTAALGVQYRVMGYYPENPQGGYLIVYGYYQADGRFVISHCRTNAIAKDIYNQQTYLDINTCTIRPSTPVRQ